MWWGIQVHIRSCFSSEVTFWIKTKPMLSGTSFSDNSYLIRHMRAHNEKKPDSAATVTNHLGLVW